MNIHENLELVTKSMNEAFAGSFLNKFQQLSTYDFFMGFSKGKSSNVVLSINLRSPFIKITDDKFTQNQNSAFFQKIKSRIFNAFLLKVSLLNNDNIVCLDFIKTTDAYDKIKYQLVIELFKNNTNIILLNENKIVEAYHLKGLETNHPILNNLTYEFPKKADNFKDFTCEDQNKIDEYYSSINQQYLKEKYSILITLIKRKRKSLSKKLEKLQIENTVAKENEKYKEYGDYLKMNFNHINRGDKSFTIDGIEIPLKEEFSPSQNLQYFYKMYKKSKATILSTEKYITDTENELQYLDNILSTLDLYTEDEYEQLELELSENKLIKISKRPKKPNKSAAEPYYVVYNGNKFGYGKNNLQNNRLTTEIANKTDSFLHIDKAHGPHIIIFKTNPSDDDIQFACELALYLAKKLDGNVIYTLVSDLRKTKNLGQVRLLKYETYHINNIRPEMEKIVNQSNRF